MGFSPTWQCPDCGGPLSNQSSGVLCCVEEQSHSFYSVAGVWRMLASGRESQLERFLHEYRTVRESEGRGSTEASYYRNLPFHAPPHHRSEWSIRASSYRALKSTLDASASYPLRVLDLGAGNCWMSARLAAAGHAVTAVDIRVDDRDGLGANQHYRVGFNTVQAEFSNLPLGDRQFDLAIWNASFHYSTDYEADLREAVRVLRSTGRIAIVDSPVYSDPSSGSKMVQERERDFLRRFGFASNALPSEGFLSYRRLEALSAATGVRWEFKRPTYGMRWRLRPLKARLLRRREPAQFLLILGRLEDH